eukprot:TRINITY_DN19563_c0_g1_i1.p1 TRINITY_DN19563_c0_g1~~TRINITY_DN19563_c0_g1_i1.p1  ORF type:complete len:364 (+),score=60.02 TRINITY_DN19563_c0_g1_i1:139-1230(+)
MAVGAVGAIIGGKKAWEAKDGGSLELGSFKFTYIDVYDQRDLKEPLHLPVPAAFLPNLSRKKKTNLMQDKEAACRWLSRALQKRVTAIYIQRQSDDSWQLLLFPLPDDSPPFQDGTIAVVCCDGRGLHPDITEKLPLKQLEEVKRRGVFAWINKTVGAFSTRSLGRTNPTAQVTTHLADVRQGLSELMAEDTSASQERMLEETLLAAAREEPNGEETHEENRARRTLDRKASFAKLTQNLTHIATLIEQHGSSFISEASQSEDLAGQGNESISLHLRALAATLELDALVSEDELVEPPRMSSKTKSNVAEINTVPLDVPPPVSMPTHRQDTLCCFSAACNTTGCGSQIQEDDEELGDVKRISS